LFLDETGGSRATCAPPLDTTSEVRDSIKQTIDLVLMLPPGHARERASV
jgi:hypothetical protein